jgi:chemotaxis protein methyltransferase WspC
VRTVSARAIETVVRDRLGLDPSALGPNVLERAIEVRMSARGLADPAIYTAQLITESAERAALAAELAVSETWFFRGGRALFDRLAGFVADRAVGRAPGAVVRVLSVPCSTGEEPYSLAVALHERFLTPREFAIDAVDVSSRALARAAAARYGGFAFRESGVDIRPVYFRTAEGAWELLPHLRTGVRFAPGNLTDPLFLADERAYDLILCRNLFIYLTPEARGRALANFDRLLARDGWLCVTPAEADRLPAGDFSPDGPTELGIYRRASAAGTVPQVGERRVVFKTRPGREVEHSGRLEPWEVGRLAPREPVPVPESQPVPPMQTPPMPSAIGAARVLADAGRLDEARAMCETLLRTYPASADALALLGVVHLAAGRTTDADEAFRKALYLEPDHIEAMEHVIALCVRRGDTARAAALQRRLARLVAPEAKEGQ